MKIERKDVFNDKEINIIENGIESSNIDKYKWNFRPFMVACKENDEIIGESQYGSGWDCMTSVQAFYWIQIL
ncbi:MAG: hypothetical protein GY730_07065 [bacterium]|nr:hypothetical protein [bacterium]